MSSFLGGQRDASPSLRELLKGPEPVLAPGAFDGLSARLIEAAGFPAVYMTGFGSAASLLGRPDVGLLGMSEMVNNARRIVEAVQVPVVADADTGYGNPVNVIRTVHEYERAGVAAIHLEDQLVPKKCGHMEGKQLVSGEEMVAKVRAAVAARHTDLILIARTDARAVEGMGSALERARAYREAGADVLFVEAPRANTRSRRWPRPSRTCRCSSTGQKGARPHRSGTRGCANWVFASSSFPSVCCCRRHAPCRTCSSGSARTGHPRQPCRHSRASMNSSI
ncbi:MAG: isocitrate lyase/PEP mutase family protein [Solirubrobacterales bacterium]|nr:isocitrate lyase/PEP mutase family protein [Solirubrobacterales bacterium]